MRNSLLLQAGGWAAVRDPAWFGLPRGRYPVLALVTLALIGGLATAASAQTRCTRDGDWLVCDDGERVPIAQDPNARPRMGVGRGWPGGSDGGRDPWMTDGARLPGPEGQECWPHGDHVHCQ